MAVWRWNGWFSFYERRFPTQATSTSRTGPAAATTSRSTSRAGASTGCRSWSSTSSSTRRSPTRSPMAPFTSCESERKEPMPELRERIEEVIETAPVALFMKGTPQFVMCGNSQRALEALRSTGAPVTAGDILPHPPIPQELSGLSGWPTIPQVFVRGELIGGADIVEELERTGQLELALRDKLGDKFPAEERVVAVA